MRTYSTLPSLLSYVACTQKFQFATNYQSIFSNKYCEIYIYCYGFSLSFRPNERTVKAAEKAKSSNVGNHAICRSRAVDTSTPKVRTQVSAAGVKCSPILFTPIQRNIPWVEKLSPDDYGKNGAAWPWERAKSLRQVHRTSKSRG